MFSSIRPSPIDGLGLFAEEPIKAGTVVWEFDPRFDVIVPERALETALAPVRAFFERFGYARSDMPGCLVLDSDDGRYTNHSNDPNLDCSVPGRGVARRDIAVGEEITCNYDELEQRAYRMLPPREHFERPEAHAADLVTIHPAALQIRAIPSGRPAAVACAGGRGRRR